MNMLDCVASSTTYADDLDELLLSNSLIVFKVDELVCVVHLSKEVRELD